MKQCHSFKSTRINCEINLLGMDQILLSSRGLEIDSVLLKMQSMSAMYLNLALCCLTGTLYANSVFTAPQCHQGFNFFLYCWRHMSMRIKILLSGSRIQTHICAHRHVCSFSLRISLSLLPLWHTDCLTGQEVPGQGMSGIS